MTEVQQQGPVRVALIGSGRMGSFHGETLARRLPGAVLAAVADPAPGAAEKLAASLGAAKFATDPAEVFADPDIDAVVIAAPARFHADLVVAAAAAGKGVFCEKPMAFTLADADRAINAARAAGVVLQVGFNRRYAPDWAAARALLDDGRLGTPRLLRSVTRDPGGFDPARVAPNTIFTETLIHDFDALRFLNPGATAVEVFATATALVEPDWKDRGLLDTAVVVVRFDNGAVGTAEACFEAVLRVRRPRRGLRLRRDGHHGRRPAHRNGVLRRGRRAGRDGPQRSGIVVRRVHRGTGRIRGRRPHRRVRRRQR